MLVAQSIIEAPVIFAFIISLIIRANFNDGITIFEGIKFLAAGICIALGSIGPSTGQAVFAESSCKSIGLNTDAYNKIFPFSIINEAVIETPLIFCLLVSILILFMPIQATSPLSSSICFLAAAFTIGFGALGTATAAGFVAAKSSKQIALEPKNYSILFRTTILCQAFIESAVIYTLIIALALITRKF